MALEHRIQQLKDHPNLNWRVSFILRKKNYLPVANCYITVYSDIYPYPVAVSSQNQAGGGLSQAFRERGKK